MHLLLALLAMLASLLGLAGRDEARVLPYAGGNAEPISSPEIIDYRNRQFDPATGRFLQRDPVLGGDELFNPYCFPSNNPVTNADPMGDHAFVFGQDAAQTFVGTLSKKFGYETYAVRLDDEEDLYVILPMPGSKKPDAWSPEMRSCRNLRQVVGSVGRQDFNMIYRRGADGKMGWENWYGSSAEDLVYVSGVLPLGARVMNDDPSWIIATGERVAGSVAGSVGFIADIGVAGYEGYAGLFDEEAYARNEQRLEALWQLQDEVLEEGLFGRASRAMGERYEAVIEAEIAGDRFAAGKIVGDTGMRLYIAADGTIRVIKGGMAAAGAISTESTSLVAQGGAIAVAGGRIIVSSAALNAAGVLVVQGTGLMMFSGSPGYNSGGGKNYKHSNWARREAARARYEQARAEYERLRSKPNKTPADKELEGRARRTMDKAKRDMDFTGEQHSQRGKG